VCGGIRQVSLKSSAGRGAMPGFCVFAAGAGLVWPATDATAKTTRQVSVRVVRT
jgi:hypothetical protein